MTSSPLFKSAKSALRFLSSLEPAETSSNISGGGGGGGGGGAAGPPLVALTVNVKMLDSNYWLLNICVIFSVELKFDGTFNFTFDCLRIAPLRVPNKTSCVILLHHGM